MSKICYSIKLLAYLYCLRVEQLLKCFCSLGKFW